MTSMSHQSDLPHSPDRLNYVSLNTYGVEWNLHGQGDVVAAESLPTRGTRLCRAERSHEHAMINVDK